jgi:phosphoribosylamine---glycine ligase
MQVLEEIVQRTADAMVAEGVPFRGVLFAGLMIKDGKAKLLEHNVRFGDPECQCLMQRLDSDLLPVLLRAAKGGLGDQSEQIQLKWSSDSALGVVMATEGYPGSYKSGSKLLGVAEVQPEVAKVFHAGTAEKDGYLVASGGRVLCVTARDAKVSEAQRKAYEGVKAIDWPEGFYRSDIGWRAVQREAEGRADELS